MRIISNFKDYYDCCQKDGINREVVYIRREKTVKYNEKHLNSGWDKKIITRLLKKSIRILQDKGLTKYGKEYVDNLTGN